MKKIAMILMMLLTLSACGQSDSVPVTVPETTAAAECAHSWADATCQKSRYCTVCGLEDGDPGSHTLVPQTLTCTISETGLPEEPYIFTGPCSTCGEVDCTGYLDWMQSPADLILGRWDAHSYLSFEDGMQEAPADMAWMEFREDGTAVHCVNGNSIEGSWSFESLLCSMGVEAPAEIPAAPGNSKFYAPLVMDYRFRYIVYIEDGNGKKIPIEKTIEVWFCGQDLRDQHFREGADAYRYEFFATKQ